MKLRSAERGFTLVEVVVVLPVVLITCVFLIGLLVSKNGELYERNARITLRLEGLLTLDKLQDELSFASKFNDNLRAPLSDPNAPSGGWKYNTTPSSTLIIDLPAIDKPRKDPSRQFVYYTSGTYAGQIAVNDIIYFVSGNTLWRRVVAPNTSQVSPANYFLKTCPESAATANCQKDLEMSRHVASMSVDYYDVDNVLVNNNPIVADKAKVTLNMTDTANGKQINETVSITVKKYNDF